MSNQFYKDLARGQRAEQIAIDILRKNISWYNFASVGTEQYYWHKGDILGVREDGKITMFEVKDDSRIADTGNVFCEEEVRYYATGTTQIGFMYNQYDILCILSQQDKKLYLIDFNTLKQIYKTGTFKTAKHQTQETDGYLVPLAQVQAQGGLIATYSYATGFEF